MHGERRNWIKTLGTLTYATTAPWLSPARRRMPRWLWSLLFWGAPVVLLIWGILVGRLLFGEIAPGDRDATQALLAPITLITVTSAALICALVSLYAPGQTTLDFTTLVLPVSDFQRSAATTLGVLGITVAASAVIIGPFVQPVASAATGSSKLSFLTAAAASAVTWALAARALYLINRWVLVRLLHLGPGLGSHILAAVLLVLGIVLLITSALGQATATSGAVGLFERALDESLTGWWSTSQLVLASLLILAVLAVVLGTAAVASLDGQGARRSTGSWRLRGVSRLLARRLTGIHIIAWVRFPTNLASLALIVSATAVLILVRRNEDPDYWFNAAFLLLSATSTLGVGSYGSTAEHHWMYAAMSRPTSWVGPKLASVLAIWSAVTLTCVAVFITLTNWVAADAIGLAPILFAELWVGALFGALVPVGLKYSLQSAFSEAVAIIGTLIFVVLVTTGLGGGAGPPWVEGLLMTAAAVIAYVVVGVRRARRGALPGAF